MRRYAARLIKLPPHNERASLVFDNTTGLPADTPSAYLVMNELGNKSFNTTNFHAGVLAQLYNWAEEMGIDIKERFETCEMFALEEITSLSHYLSKNQRQDYDELKPRVGGNTHKQKTGTVIHFLQWLSDRYYMKRRPGDPVAENLRERTAIALRRMHKLIIEGVGKRRLGLTIEEQKVLLEIIRMDNPANPFKGFNKERNYLFFLMLFVTGMRVGELLKLTLLDLKLEENPPFIHLTGEEIVEDPRLHKMVLKTRGRDIPLSRDMARLVQQFINGSRKFRKAARKTEPYLFLNSRIDTTPLTRSAAYSMVYTLRKADPRLKVLTPHRLRSTWNDNFDRMFEESGMTKEKLDQIKRYLCGWTSTSMEPDKYNLRSTMELSQKLSLELQDAMFSSLEAAKWKL